MTSPQTIELLCPKEAATLLGLSVRTLARYRAERTGPHWTTIGRQIRYRIASLNDWIIANEVSPNR